MVCVNIFIFWNHNSDTSESSTLSTSSQGDADNDGETDSESQSSFELIQLSDWIDDLSYTVTSIFKITNCLNFTVSNVTIFGEALMEKYSPPVNIAQPNFLHAYDNS